MENFKINDRLLTAVPFVREGARFADIGTDHAYLPIFLLANGKIKSAVAADINNGPLQKARENSVKYGFESDIAPVLCDGLRAIDGDSVDDIAIFGMGGELIIKIIDEAPWLRSCEKRLILQPMTHPEKLRAYLAQSGYRIIGESLSLDRGKIYQTICAEYDGIKRDFDDFTLLFGEYILSTGGELLDSLMRSALLQLQRRILGKEAGGEDTKADRELLEKIEKYIAR